jgi:uncharacterized membrane protein
MISFKVLLLIVPGIILGAYGSILLKKGAKDFTLDLSKLKNNMTALFGLFLYGISSILYVMALALEKLSVIYPLSAITYIVISFLSIKHLGEKMSKAKWLGIGLIIIGTFLVVS